MKLSSHKSRGAKTELSMTSMIDIVFLLLVFFMVTASFNETERELDSSIKVEEKSADSPPSDFEIAIVEIAPVGGGYVYRLSGRDFNTQEELFELLDKFPNKTDGAFVRVPDDAPFDMAASAVQACKSARFIGVSYVPGDAK